MRSAGLTTDKTIRALFFALSCWVIAGHAHDGLDLAPPRAVPEAWNVITLCHANMRHLSAEERWAEVPIQSSLSIQALRFLRETAPPDPAIGSRRAQIEELEKVALAIFNACQGSAAEEAKKLLAHYSTRLGELARGYDAAIVHAIVYSCPMCRGIRELDPKTPCFKCGMDLEARSIPASEVYNTPGEPSILLTPIMERPLVVGEARSVRLRIRRKKDAAPITPDDLLVVHTERIHLLIIDESLGDYHHEHPLPTEVPGEYLFTIIPKRPGAYRIFADLVPKLSRVQEYAVCDLPGSARGEALQDRVSTFASSAGDLKFNLQWRTPPSGLRAKVPVNAQVTVFAPDGTPFNQLEPVMGTYAHIVGFYEDRQTVLHIHPSGGPEPQRPEDRGGPLMKFRFFAPKPGFIRLYVQVQVGGTSRFAPFNVSILP